MEFDLEVLEKKIGKERLELINRVEDICERIMGLTL